MTVPHAFTAAGVYTVKVTAADPDGCTSPAATTTVSVAVAAVEPDPLNPGQQALFRRRDYGG